MKKLCTFKFVLLTILFISFNNFSIYPNPSTNDINLKVPKLASDAIVNVYDVLGKQVFGGAILSNEKINIFNFNSGICLNRIPA